jgi:hypothetical protein
LPDVLRSATERIKLCDSAEREAIFPALQAGPGSASISPRLREPDVGTLTVLGFGVATLLRGGDPRRSNKLMQSRVIMRALALVLLAMLMLLAQH